MGLKYAVFHNIVHITLALILGYILRLDYFGYLLILVVTFVPDLDHLGYVKKQGIKGALYTRIYKDFGKPRKYPIHHLGLLLVSGILTFVFLYFDFLLLGAIFSAILVHMLWDLFEDMIIFRIGIKYWL